MFDNVIKVKDTKETTNIINIKSNSLQLDIPKDFKKAVGLALTLKEHNPDLPISVAVSPETEIMIMPYKNLFDKIIIQRTDLKGFEQKLYLDEYSPYKNTFFFDSDILVIKDIMPIIERWKGHAYAVRGSLAVDGVSSFGLDREFVLNIIKKDKFVVIDGAGHAYFEKPACKTIFDKAREITRQYQVFQANKFADEESVYVIKSNGKIVSPAQLSGAFFRVKDGALEPGDTIVVPLEVQPFSGIRATAEVTQIIYQLGLAAAALNSITN